MHDQHFLPWIGTLFPAHPNRGLRLLVLGESHYGELGTETPEFTNTVVLGGAIQRRNRFFTSAAKLVLGVPTGMYLTTERRVEFWQSVAFYNYIPTFVGATARIRPSHEHWRAAVHPFGKVLTQLRPHAVLVLGKALWHHLNGLVPIDDHPELSRLPIPDSAGAAAIVTMAEHPSAFGFKLGEWQPRVQSMIKMTGIDSPFRSGDTAA